jgi:hypothetical protein
MTGLLILQLALLACALALASGVLSAKPFPQDQITLVIGPEGRVVYVNADDVFPRSTDPPGGVRSHGSGPEAIRQVIGQTARRLEVDPGLVDAVVKVESGYDPRALSPKGAQGLMQLIPSTAARFSVQNPFDPAENVRGGVTYLRQLLRQFDGNVPLTLAAYNAGEGAVERYGGVPPYGETRDYVRRVTEIYPRTRIAPPSTEASGSDHARAGISGESRAPDNAARAAPIYQYVDERGIIHFAQ